MIERLVIMTKVQRIRTALPIFVLAPFLVAADSEPDVDSGGAVDASQARGTFVRESSTDRQPSLTAFPSYPSIARRDRIEGEATVCFDIDTRGKVKRASIESYSHKIFRKPSLRAIRKSSFEPLRPDQVKARAKTCRTYRFRLDPILADE